MTTSPSPNVELDVRGLTCPEPALRTKQALDSLPSGTVTVLTDSSVSRDNIVRLGEQAGCQVSWQEREPGVYAVQLAKNAAGQCPEAMAGALVVLTTDQLGRGAEELGRLLVTLLLRVFAESALKPTELILMNSGVKLALDGSEVLPSLCALEQQGTRIRVCGTCLDFYGVKDRLRAGVVSNLYEVVELIMAAKKAIVF